MAVDHCIYIWHCILVGHCIDVESGVEWCRTVYHESVYTSVSRELSSEQSFTLRFTTVGHLTQKTTFSPTLPVTHFLFPLGFV